MKDLPQSLIVDLSTPIRRFIDSTKFGLDTHYNDNPVFRQTYYNMLDEIIDRIIETCVRYTDSFSMILDYASECRYRLQLSMKEDKAETTAKAILALGEDVSYILKDMGAYVNGIFPYYFERRVGVDSILLKHTAIQ